MSRRLQPLARLWMVALAVSAVGCAAEHDPTPAARIAFVELTPQISSADDADPEQVGLQADVAVLFLGDADQPWDHVEIQALQGDAVIDEQLADQAGARRARARLTLPLPTDVRAPLTLRARAVGPALELEAVGCPALAHRHRRVTIHAEGPEPSVGFSLTPGVHRQKYRIFGSIRMHAASPLVVVARVATTARLRIEQLVATQNSDFTLWVATSDDDQDAD